MVGGRSESAQSKSSAGAFLHNRAAAPDDYSVLAADSFHTHQRHPSPAVGHSSGMVTTPRGRHVVHAGVAGKNIPYDARMGGSRSSTPRVGQHSGQHGGDSWGNDDATRTLMEMQEKCLLAEQRVATLSDEIRNVEDTYGRRLRTVQQEAYEEGAQQGLHSMLDLAASSKERDAAIHQLRKEVRLRREAMQAMEEEKLGLVRAVVEHRREANEAKRRYNDVAAAYQELRREYAYMCQVKGRTAQGRRVHESEFLTVMDDEENAASDDATTFQEVAGAQLDGDDTAGGQQSGKQGRRKRLCSTASQCVPSGAVLPPQDILLAMPAKAQLEAINDAITADEQLLQHIDEQKQSLQRGIEALRMTAVAVIEGKLKRLNDEQSEFHNMLASHTLPSYASKAFGGVAGALKSSRSAAAEVPRGHDVSNRSLSGEMMEAGLSGLRTIHSNPQGALHRAPPAASLPITSQLQGSFDAMKTRTGAAEGNGVAGTTAAAPSRRVRSNAADVGLYAGGSFASNVNNSGEYFSVVPEQLVPNNSIASHVMDDGLSLSSSAVLQRQSSSVVGGLGTRSSVFSPKSLQSTSMALPPVPENSLRTMDSSVSMPAVPPNSLAASNQALGSPMMAQADVSTAVPTIPSSSTPAQPRYTDPTAVGDDGEAHKRKLLLSPAQRASDDRHGIPERDPTLLDGTLPAPNNPSGVSGGDQTRGVKLTSLMETLHAMHHQQGTDDDLLVEERGQSSVGQRATGSSMSPLVSPRRRATTVVAGLQQHDPEGRHRAASTVVGYRQSSMDARSPPARRVSLMSLQVVKGGKP